VGSPGSLGGAARHATRPVTVGALMSPPLRPGLHTTDAATRVDTVFGRE
jgi:hypothetical protein